MWSPKCNPRSPCRSVCALLKCWCCSFFCSGLPWPGSTRALVSPTELSAARSCGERADLGYHVHEATAGGAGGCVAP